MICGLLFKKTFHEHLPCHFFLHHYFQWLWVSVTCKYPNLFSHSLIVGHICCFQFFAFINKVLYASLQIRCVHLPDYFLILDA